MPMAQEAYIVLHHMYIRTLEYEDD